MRRMRIILGLLLAAVLVLAVAVPASATANFTDIAGHDYEASIVDLATNGFIGGYSDGTFRPDNPLQRQQFAKMAALTLGYEVTAADVSQFPDTPAPYDPVNNPLYPGSYAAVAAEHQIMSGYTNGLFGFADNVTRQQVISIAVRAAGDALIAAPAAYAGELDYTNANHGANIKKAEYNGMLTAILDGLEAGATWDVTAPATRGEAAAILDQLFKRTAGGDQLFTVTNVNGIPNTVTVDAPAGLAWGVTGWSGPFFSEANSGVDFLKFDVAAGADNYPVHGGDDPTTWLCYIDEGVGELILTDADKVETSRVAFNKDDVVVLNPMNWHGWDFEGAGTMYVVRVTPEAAAAGQMAKLFAAAVEANNIFTVTNVDGIPTTVTTDVPADIEWGVLGWSGPFFTEPNSGLDFLKFEIAAGADNYPVHGGDDPSTWLCYVDEGVGELILTDADKVETSRVAFDEDDIIVLNPMNWHGWDFEGAGTLYVVRVTPTP